MAGHSKWANIQHRKKAQDSKRGKLFTKFIREITVAARMGGEDIDTNPRLRIAVDKALIANMSRDTLDRAIKRGAHGLDSDQVEEIVYEGYGAGGVAVMAMCLTDNRNRTVAEVRHAFTKCGGNLGSSNSVAYLFKKQGVILFAPGSNEDAIMQHGLDAGAEDIITHDDGLIEVITTPETFSDVKQKLLDAGLSVENADVTWVAALEAAVEGEVAEKVVKLIDMLEDLDDVQDVYTNAALPDMAS